MSDMNTDTNAPVSHLPEGYTALTPFLCVDGGARAIEFYTTVFGATVVSRNDGPNGTVAHAELDFGDCRLQLADPTPEHHLVAPSGDTTVTHSYVHYVPDVDAVYATAIAHGAKGLSAPETFVTGDRYAPILDPFGHRWTIMTRVREVSPEEANRLVEEWLADQG